MKKIIDFFKWIFQSEYRKEQRQKELEFAQYQIGVITDEILNGKNLISHIHQKAVDKNSGHERERNQGRQEEINHNFRLLEYYREREIFLKKKLDPI